MVSFPPISYPDGALDASGLAAELRLEGAGAIAGALSSLRALEVGPAVVVIHQGSTHERLITAVGEVMLRQDLWEWYLRRRPAPAAAIVAQMPALSPYLRTRTAHMIARLRDEAARTEGPDSIAFLEAAAARLEHELETLAALAAPA